MITKNLIINQLPEFVNSGPKPICGLVSLSLGQQTTGSVKVFNIDHSLLPLCMAVKIGEQKFVFDDISTPQDYTFSLPRVEADAPVVFLVATNTGGRVQGVALAESPGTKMDISDLFSDDEAELDEFIEDQIAETALVPPAEPEPVPSSQDESDRELEPSAHEVEQTGNFYSLIQPQLDELFGRFPHFAELENLVANTEWVKVNYSPNDSQHYILGKLYDGEIVTHLCYGIPAASRATAPPVSLIDYCQWLPIDLNDTDGAGYWVMYQSAETGENVRL